MVGAEFWDGLFILLEPRVPSECPHHIPCKGVQSCGILDEEGAGWDWRVLKKLPSELIPSHFDTE